MDNYEIIKRLGGGSFADVFLAKEKPTSELVAIKVLKKKYRKFDECCELRECKSLQKLCKDSLQTQKGYDNIIKLKQIIFEKKTGKLNLVFEYMETDLYELMKKRSPGKLSEDEIKDITFQTLLGLYHMHKYGFFHRDMKPENLLLTGKKVKIGDFGLAREIRSIPPYTEYVSTRYYRAPECILRSTNYSSPIDIWALGCIMAEMYMHPMPLFYGQTEKEVFIKICSVLGSPTPSNWLEGINQANLIGMKYPQSSGTDLATIVKGASPEAIDLMKQMLKWDPNCRATAAALLNHPFFNGCGYDLKKSTNTNFFNDFGDVKAFNKTNRRFRPDPNNKETEKKNDDDNMFSKVLNDTKGFNDLLNKLKNEENEENKNYEKNKYKNDFNILDDTFYKKHLNNNYDGNNKDKKIINEEKENENDSDSEENNKKKTKKEKDEYNDFNFDFNENKNKANDNNYDSNKKKESEYDYLFDSDTKNNNRNYGLRDNFRRKTNRKKTNKNNNNNIKEDPLDILLKKNNEKDFSNIDSEINKILGKDIGLNYNKSNKNQFSYKNNNNNNNNDIFGVRFKSDKVKSNSNINDINFGEKPYEKSNLKPIINGGRRGGGGLFALGYEPNKDPIFGDLNLGGLGLNRNNQDNNNYNNKYGFKRDLKPVIKKDNRNDNIFGFNNRENNLSSLGGLGFNNHLGKNDKFSIFERNNPLMNQFNNEMNGVSKRRRNFYSSPNNLGNYGWGGL